MNKYTNKITLVKNDRGCWGLDPFKGCQHGLNHKYTGYDCGLNLFSNNNYGCYNSAGCYGVCYANRLAKARGFEFDKTIKRDFINDKHLQEIGKQLKSVPFVRLGVSCDPSEDWGHTLGIIDKIKPFNKNIVVITKHWKELSKVQLNKLDGICINTSISALDNKFDRDYRLAWYQKLKDYCKSVLRVNTAYFNDTKLNQIQEELLDNENVIDNILRFHKTHELVKNGIVNVKKHKYLKGYVNASKHNQNTYFGYCDTCPDQCGITL